MGVEGPFLGSKSAGAWSWSFTEIKDSITPLPQTSSSRGAELIKPRDNFTLLFNQPNAESEMKP
jgi:hypothetical protein